MAAAGVIVYSGIETIRSERDLLLLKQETETISRFDVAAEVTLTGDWKSAPSDFLTISGRANAE